MAKEDNRDDQEPSEVVQTPEEQAAADGQEPNVDTATDGEESTIDSLKTQVATLTAAMDAAKEQVLRAEADSQNARRRAQQDVEKAHKFGQERLVVDLLPVVDNLERSLANLDQSNPQFKAVVEGIQLTLKSFVDALAKHKVEMVDPQGEPFDPELHQAMSMMDNPDVEPNTVMEVFQRGYTLNGRLVRPAMVVVSKSPQ